MALAVVFFVTTNQKKNSYVKGLFRCLYEMNWAWLAGLERPLYRWLFLVAVLI